MSDGMPANLVERLRARVVFSLTNKNRDRPDPLCIEAAAEIERLQADLAAKHHQFLYEAEKHSEWLEKFMTMKARAEAAEAQRDKLAALVEQAFRDGLIYASNVVVNDPDLAWQHSRAREALEQVGKR